MSNAARDPKTSVEICSYQFPFVAREFVWTGFDYQQSFEAKEWNAYNGFCEVIVRSTGQPGRISLKAASPGLRSVTAHLKAK